jgi:glutathionyl-hydroquinone reductase
MGFSISWLATPSKNANDVLGHLGLSETGSKEWMPESPVVAAKVETGWYVIFFNDANPKALKPEILRKLSASANVVVCQVEEHAMVSAAAEWQEGKEVWYVMHDSEDGLTNLDSSGVLPVVYAAIRDSQLAKQTSSRVDHVIDVPILLAQHLTGFRHDEGFDDAVVEPFTVLCESR